CLESSSNCKFEIVSLLVNREGYARRLTIKEAMDAVWVDRKDQAEWGIDDRHHDLQFNAGAGPESGVCSWQEFYLLGGHLPRAVQLLSRQLTLVQPPRVSDVEVGRHRKYAADDRDPILDIQHTLSITADVYDVIKRTRDGIACLRIGDSHTSHHVSNGRNLP